MSRKITHLNFDWKYSESYCDDSMKKDFDDSSYICVNIPHANKEIPYNNFNERIYQFVSSYRKHIEIDKKLLGNDRLILYFEGVANMATVYVNGEKCGEHKCAYTEFSYDITDLVTDGDNVIAVCVDSTERNDMPPFGNRVDYLCYGGIYREVRLEQVPCEYIRYVFIRTKNILSEKKYLDADISFNKAVNGTVNLQLFDGDKLIREHSFTATGETVNFKWNTPGVSLWSQEKPKLYTLKVYFGDDEKEYRFGYRQCEFTKNGFLLNGKPVKIRGLNRHQSYPYVGYAMPSSAQRADADFLKYTLGVNFVRTSHYPDSRHFLDRCDEIGLIVFTEIPSWQHIGTGEWREICLQNVRDMVIRDRNHPSVVLWGVRINESMDCDELYSETNRIAHSLDDTRQTGGVRAIPHSHLFEDVYTYNDFVHSGGRTALLPSFAVAGNAPYLITEHNGHMYPVKSFDREEIRTEHALRHARVLNKAYSNSRRSGAVGWCMSDYNTHEDFGSGDKICYHGVSDMFRVPKPCGMFYASQQDDVPVLEISSSMDIGEHPACKMGQLYAFTNCDYVKIYKNGKYASTAYPDKGRFKHLPHPPVFLNDFVGDSLISEDGITPVSSKLIKPLLAAAVRESWQFPFYYYIGAAAGVVLSGKKISDMIPVINKHISAWGGGSNEYKFEGYKDGECVKTVIKTTVSEASLKVAADSLSLTEKETYDVTRVSLEAVDQNGNRLYFASNGVTLKAKGAVEIIGPQNISLIGGDRAFWVKTKGKSGKGEVVITAENLGEYRISFNVKKVDLL